MKSILRWSAPLIFILLFSTNSNSQTSVEIAGVYNTTQGQSLCNLPYNYSFYTYGSSLNYDYQTDSIELFVNWGDGSTTVSKYGLYQDSTGGNPWYSDNLAHTFSSAGNYSIVIIAAGPDGAADTASNQLILSTNCVTIEGYAYTDTDSDCVFDVTENPLQYLNILLKDSLGNVLAVPTTDNQGHYSIQFPQGITNLSLQADFSGAQGNPIVSCPVAGGYTVNTTSSLSLDFGVTIPKQVSITYVSDNSGSSFHCPVPSTVNLYVSGTAQGYTANQDSVELTVLWGDGMTTTFNLPVYGSALYTYWSAQGLIHTYSIAGTFSPVFIVSAAGSGSDSSFYSMTFSNCSLIDGSIYSDNNSNCVFDAGDDTLSGIGVSIYDANGNFIASGFSNANGAYSISVPQGLINLSIQPNLNYYNSVDSVSCPASGNYSFSSTSNQTFNFGLICSQALFDLYAYHGVSGVGAPGNYGQVRVYGGNYSCAAINGTVTLILPSGISYSGMIGGPAPTSISGDTLRWNSTFNGGSYGWWNADFAVTLQIYTATSATVFDTAHFSVSVSPLGGDVNTQNNTNQWNLIIGGPFDPNSKQVSPEGIGGQGFVQPETAFTYTVNFQNTGTAQANNIFVLDTISSNLDMSSLQLMATSHDMNPIIYNGNVIRFDFPNINLPDSNANEPASHGWVIYSIKTKAGLSTGTQIKNTGYIYFDYNAPIVTNTTLNTIDAALSVNSALATKENNFIFPNPANNSFTLKFERQINGTLKISDVLGRVVKEVSIADTKEKNIDVSALQNGIYTISIPGINLQQRTLLIAR
jgi:uncharacterized repeat protein (TIGR01451 family)